ncbi:MAG: phage holin family protein [Saprospiraceae bacterium]
MELIENPQNRLELLANHIVDYLDSRRDLFMLDMTAKGVGVASGIVAGVIASFFGFITLLFGCLGAAKLIGDALNNPAAGYFIISGASLLLLLLAFTLARRYIRDAVVNYVVKTLREGEFNEKQA